MPYMDAPNLCQAFLRVTRPTGIDCSRTSVYGLPHRINTSSQQGKGRDCIRIFGFIVMRLQRIESGAASNLCRCRLIKSVESDRTEMTHFGPRADVGKDLHSFLKAAARAACMSRVAMDLGLRGQFLNYRTVRVLSVRIALGH